MRLTVNSDFIIFGTQPQSGFTTNFFYSWEDANPDHSAELYINFSINSSEIDGEEFAQELFEVVRHHYFKDFHVGAHERFEETLNEVNRLSLDWREKKQVKFFSDVHVVIGIIQKGTLYLTQAGNAEVYLIRKRHVTVISEGLSDANKDRENLFSNVASGQLEDSDTVIFTTSRLLRYVGKSDLAKIFMRDSSLASSFNDLKDSIEMELDHRVNILALNIINQRASADESDDLTIVEKKSSIQLSGALNGLKDRLANLKNVKKGKNEIEKGAENMHVKTRDQRRKPLVNVDNLKDFSNFGKDKVLVALVLVIVILLGGLYTVRTKAKDRQAREHLESLLFDAKQDLDEAATRGTFDKEKAADLIDRAEGNIHLVMESGEFRNKALSYLEEVNDARDQLDNIIRVEEPLVLADLTKFKADVNSVGVLPLGEDLYAYEYNTLHKVMLDQVQEPTVVDENEEIMDGVYFGDQESLLFLTKSHKVIEFAENFVKFMDTTDPAWKSAIAVEAYGPRVYLLDPAENSIWRYRRGKESYTGAQLYSTEGDITNAVDIAIDGSVYILKSDGEITKYYAGEIEEDFYVVREPMVPVQKPTRIFTEFEFTQVYILEPTQSRILVYNKDVKNGNLVYSHQYHFDSSVGELRDVYVEKEHKKIYVLTDSKIYQLEM